LPTLTHFVLETCDLDAIIYTDHWGNYNDLGDLQRDRVNAPHGQGRSRGRLVAGALLRFPIRRRARVVPNSRAESRYHLARANHLND